MYVTFIQKTSLTSFEPQHVYGVTCHSYSITTAAISSKDTKQCWLVSVPIFCAMAVTEFVLILLWNWK